MAHLGKPDDVPGILITRQFMAEVQCAEHGTPIGIALVQATGPTKADEILAATDSVIGVRHSGLLEVTDYGLFTDLMGLGLRPW